MDSKFIINTIDSISIQQPKDVVMTHIADYIDDKCKKGIIPYSHSTDLLRLELLIKFGGTWIDSTVLCTNDNYPKDMLDSELFLYHFQNSKKDEFTGISSWFISAYSNNKLLMILRDMLYQYWKDYDCLIDYFVLHKFSK